MKRVLCMLLVAAMLGCGLAAVAEPYQSYIYNAYDEPVYAPDLYTVRNTWSGGSLDIGELNEPGGLVCGADGYLYLTDTKNNRIIRLSPDLTEKTVYTAFTRGEETLTLNGPRAVFATGDGTLYIADTGARRILIGNVDGTVRAVLEKPQSELFPADKEFLPTDLVVTGTGVLYALCDGIYQGAVVFDEEHQFSGFFGSNTVEITLQVIAESLWKKIATKEQRSRMARYVPVQYSSIAIDGEDFVYTTVASTEDPASRVRRLNPLGNNILVGTDGRTLTFGDPEKTTYAGSTEMTTLTSVAVCGSGMFAVLDRTGCKVFVYSRDGDLLSVFGGPGNFEGCFVDPTALCFSGTDLLVLDQKKGVITTFSLTSYGEKLLQALEVYMDGRYAESLPLWQEVLRYDAGSYLAALGYGKALYQLGDYEQAMGYFERANDKRRYSDAYQEKLSREMRAHFTGIVVTAALVIAVPLVLLRRQRGKRMVAWLKRRRKQKKGGTICDTKP